MTIYVINVVQCVDCEYCAKGTESNDNFICMPRGEAVSVHDYCSKGKRKEFNNELDNGSTGN